MKTDSIDLYEIIINIDTQGVRARRERYKTKRTSLNFIALRITDEEHAQGYSYRMCPSRVPVADLLKVRSISWSSDHVFRHGYCLKDQQQQMFAALHANVEAQLARTKANADKLTEIWTAEDIKLMSRVPDKDTCQT